MSDNDVVSNSPSATNPDIPVRSSETAGGKKIQHVRLDLGSGTAEEVVAGTVPISGTVGVSGTIPVTGTVDTTGSTVAISGTPNVQIEEAVGFFDRAIALLYLLVEQVRSPSWLVKSSVGTDRVPVTFAAVDANINSVSTVSTVSNMTNLGGLPAQELLYSAMWTQYQTGARNFIT